MLLAEAKEDAANRPLGKNFPALKAADFLCDYMVKEGDSIQPRMAEMARTITNCPAMKILRLYAEAWMIRFGKILEVFYTKCGSGFDGIHRNNPEYIERRDEGSVLRVFHVQIRCFVQVRRRLIRNTENGRRKAKKPVQIRSALPLLFAVLMTIAYGINLRLSESARTSPNAFVALKRHSENIRSDRAGNRSRGESNSFF